MIRYAVSSCCCFIVTAWAVFVVADDAVAGCHGSWPVAGGASDRPAKDGLNRISRIKYPDSTPLGASS